MTALVVNCSTDVTLIHLSVISILLYMIYLRILDPPSDAGFVHSIVTESFSVFVTLTFSGAGGTPSKTDTIKYFNILTLK